MIRVCDPLAFHHPIPPWNTHMSLQLQFFFRVSLGCLLFQWGIPFFMGFARSRVRPRSGCCRVGGSGGVRPPARQPRTQPCATPNPCGRGSSLSSFRSSFSFPFLLSAPAVKGSQPRGRPPCACMSRVCMSRGNYVCNFACGGVRWQPCGWVACCTLPLYTFVSTATSCSAYKYIQSSRQQPFTIVKIQ